MSETQPELNTMSETQLELNTNVMQQKARVNDTTWTQKSDSADRKQQELCISTKLLMLRRTLDMHLAMKISHANLISTCTTLWTSVYNLLTHLSLSFWKTTMETLVPVFILSSLDLLSPSLWLSSKPQQNLDNSKQGSSSELQKQIIVQHTCKFYTGFQQRQTFMTELFFYSKAIKFFFFFCSQHHTNLLNIYTSRLLHSSDDTVFSLYTSKLMANAVFLHCSYSLEYKWFCSLL